MHFHVCFDDVLVLFFVFSALGCLGMASLLASIYRIPAILAPYPQFLMYLAVGLFVARQYHYESRCAKCNTFYAMKEFGTPTNREVPVKGGVQATTTRTYRCSHCGDEMTKKANWFIEDETDD